ncbi:MAG: polysaccharide biosynthesis tyrosine autokinase [Candidatus Omnitrophica bacterium]|nr:polysaccharide biosynthesis tyrosine autokinase [Candidatus Omnitrophota bacterium]
MITHPQEQEIHIRDYIEILRRRWAVAVLFFLSVVFLVTVGSFIMTPIYRATVTLLIDMESPNILTTSGMVSLDTQQYYSYKEYYQSQTEIITSLGIINKVFHEFGLEQQKEYRESKEPRKKFLKTIRVEPVRDTRLVRLYVDNKDPVLAAKIANRIAEIYVKRNLYYISRDELTNLLKNEYLKLEAKQAEYNKIYKDKHPKMIRLHQEMREMADRINAAKKATFNSDFFTEQVTGPNLEGALAGFKANNVSVQDQAEIPTVPIKPKKLLNIILSVIVGALGGMALAFFFEYLDNTIKTSDDIAMMTRKPFLGSVPDITKMTGKMTDFERDMLVHRKPKDPVAEAYRSIRTSILFSFTEEHPLKSLVVTSPGPQEGKTTTLCNLGIAMAQNNRRILLVDADMRKPRLHDTFGKKNTEGLSNFLSCQSTFDELLQETGVENLFLISGGPNPPNPSELLSSKKMKEFIGIAQQKFDIIFFDTPPIAVVTDAAVLTHHTDGIIVVIRSHTTSKKVIPRIFAILEEAKSNVIGVILNKVDITKGNPYYYYYSHYYGK